MQPVPKNTPVRAMVCLVVVVDEFQKLVVYEALCRCPRKVLHAPASQARTERRDRSHAHEVRGTNHLVIAWKDVSKHHSAHI